MMYEDVLSVERIGPLFAEVVRQAGEGYVVGGCVRDVLLGREVTDLDIVVVGEAGSLAARLAARFGGRLGAPSPFGTQALFIGDSRIDLASARSESYSEPAALPTVSLAGIEEDLLRRDFTINSMALDLRPTSFGTLVDPCGGTADLQARRIRVLHDLSFIDDPTRIFRAVRLASRLGFELTSGTATLMARALQQQLVRKLSAARLGREIELAVAEDRLCDVARTMRDCGLWHAVDERFNIGETALESLRKLEAMKFDRLIAALALLAGDCDGERLRAVADRLNLGRRRGEMLAGAMEQARALLRDLAGGKALTPGRVYAACRGCHEPSILVAMAVSDNEKTVAALDSYLTSWRHASCDIGGMDLIAAGIPQGPAVAAGLEAAVVAKLDGEADEKERQLQVALRAARRA